MKKWVCILACTLGCLLSRDAQSAARPITLAAKHTTTLHVGDLAVLHVPSDVYQRYLHSAPDGAWLDTLNLVKRSGRDVTFRAVHPGRGVIVISPAQPDGACISCVTIRYFIEVVASSAMAERPSEPAVSV